MQISDVTDVAFQGDPFSIMKDERLAVHAFLDEPGILVGEEGWNAGWVKDCFGESQLHRIKTKPVASSGFTIGTTAQIVMYVNRMVSELEKRQPCERKGADQGVHNVLVHDGPPNFVEFVQHENNDGPVWTGGYVSTVPKDREGRVVNRRQEPYIVVHQYDRHMNLIKDLAQLPPPKSKSEPPANCDSFTISPGDTAGDDLTHSAATSQVECCVNCLEEPVCSTFVFSESRGHCWLKSSASGIDERPADDLVVGVRK